MATKILIIYTGGTIGMVEDHETGLLRPMPFQDIYEVIPELRHLSVEIAFHSFEQPLDSSEIGPDTWQKMCEVVLEKQDDYDGFVVLHGTDTMAFSSSALSFVLNRIGKPVIITGSQLPVGMIRTDGKENIIGAIEIAAAQDRDGAPVVQEVAVFFESKLMRGNRVTKLSADEFNAFNSVEYPALAKSGVEIDYRHQLLFRYTEPTLEGMEPKFAGNLAVMKMHPGMLAEVYRPLMESDALECLLIESFGSGNMPQDPALIDMLARFTERGGIIATVTQCVEGRVVMGKYSSGQALVDLGVLDGGDMTTEAAIAKLLFLMGNGFKGEKLRELFQANLAGERSNSRMQVQRASFPSVDDQA